MTIALTITAEMTRNTVTTIALECPVQTCKTFAVQLIGAIGTVGVVIATVTTWNTFAVPAAELGSGAVTVLMMTQFIALVVAVSAVILKVARPAARDAALVFALELGRFMTFRTMLRKLVRS